MDELDDSSSFNSIFSSWLDNTGLSTLLSVSVAVVGVVDEFSSGSSSFRANSSGLFGSMGTPKSVDVTKFE